MLRDAAFFPFSYFAILSNFDTPRSPLRIPHLNQSSAFDSRLVRSRKANATFLPS